MVFPGSGTSLTDLSTILAPASTLMDSVSHFAQSYLRGKCVEKCCAGMPDLSWLNITKRGKTYQITIQYAKWPQNIPNGHKIYKHFTLQDPPKLIQIGIFGLKKCHLATLIMCHTK
jgi:hypothetical protein